MLQSLERISASDKVLVGLNLGVCRRLEKMDPGQTVDNLIKIYRQFQEKVRILWPWSLKYGKESELRI